MPLAGSSRNGSIESADCATTPLVSDEGNWITMSLELVVPVLMCAALLWWIGRALSVRSMLIVTAITLAVVVGVVLVQNAGSH